MNDSFEFTLHSPLTKEDWEKISDAELENTMSVTFQTPSGRQVKYIKCEVIDKIRAEMFEEMISHSGTGEEIIQAYADGLRKGLDIIDKYKAEGSGEIHCKFTDEEIAKSFIEDVEAVKDLLLKAEGSGEYE